VTESVLGYAWSSFRRASASFRSAVSRPSEYRLRTRLRTKFSQCEPDHTRPTNRGASPMPTISASASSRSCQPSRAAARRLSWAFSHGLCPVGAMSSAARRVRTYALPITHAVTATARSAKLRQRGNGWPIPRPSCRPCPTTTSSSLCRRGSPKLPTTTRPRSTASCSRPRPRR
jgi:hypothetical protein